MARHAFRFRIVSILLESFNVIFVVHQVNFFFADVTFSPPASVFKTVIATVTYLGV